MTVEQFIFNRERPGAETAGLMRGTAILIPEEVLQNKMEHCLPGSLITTSYSSLLKMRWLQSASLYGR